MILQQGQVYKVINNTDEKFILKEIKFDNIQNTVIIILFNNGQEWEINYNSELFKYLVLDKQYDSVTEACNKEFIG